MAGQIQLMAQIPLLIGIQKSKITHVTKHNRNFFNLPVCLYYLHMIFQNESSLPCNSQAHTVLLIDVGYEVHITEPSFFSANLGAADHNNCTAVYDWFESASNQSVREFLPSMVRFTVSCTCMLPVQISRLSILKSMM